MPDEKEAVFVKLLKNLLSGLKDGSVTISKQNGEVLYLTVGETHVGFESFGEYINSQADAEPLALSESELSALLIYIDKVNYGSVTAKIKDSRIVGVEKSETHKVK